MRGQESGRASQFIELRFGISSVTPRGKSPTNNGNLTLRWSVSRWRTIKIWLYPDRDARHRCFGVDILQQ
jgi:hypothetical protein